MSDDHVIYEETELPEETSKRSKMCDSRCVKARVVQIWQNLTSQNATKESAGKYVSEAMTGALARLGDRMFLSFLLSCDEIVEWEEGEQGL